MNFSCKSQRSPVADIRLPPGMCQHITAVLGKPSPQGPPRRAGLTGTGHSPRPLPLGGIHCLTLALSARAPKVKHKFIPWKINK